MRWHFLLLAPVRPARRLRVSLRRRGQGTAPDQESLSPRPGATMFTWPTPNRVQKEWLYHRKGCGSWFTIYGIRSRTSSFFKERELINESAEKPADLHIDAERVLSFTYRGKTYQGLEGDTVARRFMPRHPVFGRS